MNRHHYITRHDILGKSKWNRLIEAGFEPAIFGLEVRRLIH